ncbi:MAG: penicillin-binding protein 2 [Candidatus Berkelbacteria bacterium]|nr:penicillin-binding protein 2 [Candidatus Berkelbacteria bacterium]
MSSFNSQTDSRVKFLAFCFLFLCLILLARLFQEAVLSHKTLTAEAKTQQQFSKTELAERGKIYFHDGGSGDDSNYAMAYDTKNFALFVIPKNIIDKKTTATKIASFVGETEMKVYDEINNDKLYLPALKKGLSSDDADKIEALDLAGVYVLPEYARYYPEGDFSAQTLGFVDGNGDGKYGFEGFYNAELTGSNGNVTGEKDTLGRIISLLGENVPKNGASYDLSIDRGINYYMYSSLEQAVQTYQAESGMAIAIEIKTGKIIGMSSTPSFDPNKYADYANNNQSDLFKNPLISTAYEPGSIFKPIIVASGLDTGKITPDSGSTFGSSVNVSGFTIHTAEGTAFGAEKIGDILKHSDNVGMVWVGQQIGSPIMDDYIKKFGFKDKTGIDLSGEGVGIIQPLKDWGQIGQATMTFGQGISVTPIQLVMAYAAIANGGVAMKPKVADKILNDDGSSAEIKPQEVGRVISTQTSAELNSMLTQVVENGYGKKAAVPGFWIAGKTGTAQLVDPATGKYTEGIFNHSFAGFAPADNPQFALLVELNKPKNAKFAESSAAPVFGNIASYILNSYYRIAPNR